MEYRKRGYQEVVSPNIYNSKLWVTSGHWDHYAVSEPFIPGDPFPNSVFSLDRKTCFSLKWRKKPLH